MHIFSTAKRGEDKPAAVKVGKKRKKRGWIIAGVIVIAVLALLIIPKRQTAAVMSYDDVSKVVRGDFSNSISASGSVESADRHLVYSTQSYTVQEIMVEVGDEVTESTQLCQLDKKSLEQQLESRETAYGVSAAASAQTVKTAQDSYNSAKASIDGGTNASLVSAESGVRTAYEAYQRAKKSYDDYASAMDDGLNAQLIAQDAAVDNAEATLDSAKSAYSDAKDALRDAQKKTVDTSEYDAQVSAARTAVTAAESARDGAQSEYDRMAVLEQELKAAYEASGSDADLSAWQQAELDKAAAAQTLSAAEKELKSAESALSQAKRAREKYAEAAAEQLDSAVDTCCRAVESAERAVDSAQTGYDNAVKSREAAYRSADNALADYAVAVDTAYSAYQSAQTAYESAKDSAQSALEQSYNSLQSARIGADTSVSELELENLRGDIDDTAIMAGAAGTVTAVYAKVGYSGAGLLFVIEDTSDLIVETSVKEYDIGEVSVGMPVSIKSEATGSEVYQGEVISIAPTANKNALGDTDTTGDIEFAVKVRVTSAKTALRVGMNVRLSYIIDSAQDVLYVPYDALYTNADGKTCIMYLEQQEKGGYIPRELAVDCGIENDTDVVVSGEGVSEGLMVVTDPDAYMSCLGKPVTLIDGTAFAMMKMTGG
jgi:HlyD family secretion protein